MVAHVSLPPPNLADLVPNVPSSLHQLIASLLEKSPERRPASADEVIALLGAIGKNSDRKTGAAVPPTMLQVSTSETLPQMVATATFPVAAQMPPTQQGEAISTPTKPRRLGLIALAVVAGVALVVVGVATFGVRNTVAERPPKPDFKDWASLSAKDEPPFPEECRSDATDVRAVMKQNVAIQPPPATPPKDWLKRVAALPDASAEKWMLLARHAGMEEERAAAASKAVIRGGQQDSALARLRAVQGRDPNYPVLAPLLGNLLLAAGRAEEAVQILRSAAGSQGGSGADGAGALWFLLGQALDATRQTTDAHAAYCKAKEAGYAEAQSRCR